ncbi:MAG: hypothetical protein ACXQS8_06960 [Candidatus Helarchaeales archaeon]
MKNTSMKTTILLIFFLLLAISLIPAIGLLEILSISDNSSSLSAQTYTSLTLINIDGSGNQLYPSIALDSAGNAHVVYSEKEGNLTSVFYRTSIDSFNSLQNVSRLAANGSNLYPDIAVDNNGVAHVIWLGMDDTSAYYQLYYSNNNGGSFGAPSILFENLTSSNNPPKIEVGSNNVVHIIFANGSMTESLIYHASSSDNFATPQIVSNLPSNAAINQNIFPEMAIDSNNVVHVSWSSLWLNVTPVGLNYSLKYNFSTLYANSQDNFATYKNVAQEYFVGNVTLSEYSGILANLTLNLMRKRSGLCVTSDGIVHITWLTVNGSGEKILYATSQDGFASNITLISDSNSSINPIFLNKPYKLAIDFLSDQTTCVGWAINRTGNHEIFLNLSSGGFSSSLQLTNMSGNDTYPTFCIDANDYFHMVWQDEDDGNTSVYYLKSKFGPLSPGLPVPPFPDIGIMTIIILFISIGSIAAISGGVIFMRWRRSSARTSGVKVAKKFPKSQKTGIKGKSSACSQEEIDQKLSMLAKNPVPPELISDPALQEYVSGEIAIVSPEIWQQVANLPLNETEKMELLSELASMTKEEAEELLQNLQSAGG